MSLIQEINNELIERKQHPSFKAGDEITVYYKVKEGKKERTQFFKGVVLQRKGRKSTETFTIRKVSNGVGVERIFPTNSPVIEKINVEKEGKVRRARIFYMRERFGKSARIKQKKKINYFFSTQEFTIEHTEASPVTLITVLHISNILSTGSITAI